MMKVMLIIIWSMIFPFVDLAAHAELINQGGGLIYDTDRDITWLQDGNYANSSDYGGANHNNGAMKWEDANAWAESLVYEGYNEWRLPKMEINNAPCEGTDCLQTEALHLFEVEGISYSSPGVFINLKVSYWSKTELQDDPDYAKSFTMSGEYYDEDKTTYQYAIAVHDGKLEPESDPVQGEDTDTDNIVGCFVSSIWPGLDDS